MAEDSQCVTEGTCQWKFIRLIWCDAAGIRRARLVPAQSWERTCLLGVGVCSACMFLPSYADVCAAAQPVGEMRIYPVRQTLRVLPWYPSHAMALITAVSQQYKDPGAALECCPRSALERVLATAQDRYGLSVKLGFESEFVFFHKDEQPQNCLPVALDHFAYCQTAAIEAAASVLDEICDALSALEIEVEQLHPESAPGQFEIVTRYSEALESCDKLLFTREAISAVANRHSLVASFLPKLWEDAAGNGCHCHFSVWKDGANILEPVEEAGSGGPSFKTDGEAFLAGVLRNLPALLCFLAPSPNSYRRLQPGCWSGAFQCWGFQNKEAALRLCNTPGLLNSCNCEIKALDATANPYIAVSAFVAAGMQGIQAGMRLPDQLNVDPGNLAPDALSEAGIHRLPEDLGQALDALNKNPDFRAVLDNLLGQSLVERFLAVRQVELEAFQRMSFAEEVQALYTRY